jgi:hypothetical protein
MMQFPLLGRYTAPVGSRLLPSVLGVPVASAPRTFCYADVSCFRTRRWLQISVLPQGPVVVTPVPAAVIEPAAVEAPVAASGFVAEALNSEPDATWSNPQAVLLFVLAGNARLTLTYNGTNIAYTYKIVAAKGHHRRPDQMHFVNVAGDVLAGGRISDDHTFRARLSNKHEATKLFADWFSDIATGHPSRSTSAKHLGTCGKCNRALTDAISMASGIGPECHFQIFGTRRPVAKKVTAARAAKAAAVVADGVDHMLAFNLGIHVDLEIAYEAALARGDLDAITDGKVAMKRQRQVIGARKPTVAQLQAVAAFEHAAADVVLAIAPHDERVDRKATARARTGNLATSLAKALQAQKAA